MIAEVGLAAPLLVFSWYLPSTGLGRKQFSAALLPFADAMVSFQGPDSSSPFVRAKGPEH